MRRAFSIVVLAALLSAIASASMPSGKYCGSYMFVISGKIELESSEFFDFHIDIGGSKTTCAHERYLVAPDGAMTMPDLKQQGNCMGHLLSSNGLDTLKIHYNANSDTIDLDAGVATVTLRHC
jgi:hypothetical protein